MPHILVIIENILFWGTIVALFFALYIYLGSLALTWYRKRKQAKASKEQEAQGPHG